MTQETALPLDSIGTLVPAETQRQAADMAQDAFARIFRLTLDAPVHELDDAVGELARRSSNWAQAGGQPDAQAARLALLVSGMDQWGLAYTQAFGLTAIHGLSALLGLLRNGLDAQADARFQQQFAAIERSEGNAIDFKMALRRNVHLALWHALIASEERDEAERLSTTLGSLMLALDSKMPQLGWRLIADTLAHIQIRCLSTTLSESAQDHTQMLFASLRQALPAERGPAVFALASQAAVSWQQASKTQPVMH